ncbi:MAG TPA: hypothetical protein VGM25_07590 [Caulobacteraceae bacterium]|jgi:hypothetical protein
MRTRLMIASATAVLLLAGGAYAQSSSASGDTAVNPPATSKLPRSVATGNAATNLSQPSGQAGTGDSTAPAVNDPVQGPSGAQRSTSSPSLNGSDAASVAPAAGAPAERAPAASAGSDLISNGPVPDTPANRAKYGQPLSHAGKITKPAGN